MSTPNLVTTLEEGSVCFLDHLIRTVGDDAAGRTTTSVDVNPDGLFWLGRLATESSVAANKYGDRGERLDPCAIGVTVRLAPAPNWTATIRMSAVIWHRPDSKVPWTKTILRPPATTVSFGPGISTLATWLALHDDAAGPAHSARVDVEVITGLDHSSECTISLVNDSAGESSSCFDANLYEVVLEVDHLATVPFELDALPDSFRYDRRVNSYGINCGVEPTESGLRTADLVVVDVSRPAYWSSNIPEPDLTFSTLAVDPLPSCDALITAYQTWRRSAWGQATLATRALEERWSDEMIAEATLASGEVTIEAKRIENGLELLAANETLLAAFRLMNEAMVLATARKSFKGWRPFQLGFLLANLNCIANPVEEADTADIVWFATGGGKTETYLGLLLTAAFHDRMTGKASGTTAWSRFPLRMLSLQQTQRFADAMAAAELVRQRHGIPGDPFSVGFLVGSGATPNRIKLEPDIPSDPNVDDDDMPAKYRVLTKCPFCAADTATHFDRVRWTLEHAWTDDRCPWGANPLPFYIVDEEIFRFLPTIVVGTVDKVALVAMQASMRGLIGAPHGRCDREGHGYTYATRAARKNGCLVPGCKGSSTPLSHEESTRIAPSFRLQDELHLLRDSLGAVDSHYEGLLDHLLQEIAGRRSKILASSATLAGYQRQIEVVYQRAARVFPNPPPSERQGFCHAGIPEDSKHE